MRKSKFWNLFHFLISVQISILLVSCTDNQHSATSENIDKQISHFQDILNMNDLTGEILIYDEISQEFYSNRFLESDVGTIPASTFKIPNTIIGLETGLLENQNHIFKWNGDSRMMKSWEEDLNLKQAFQRSCVPCFQELARGIGYQNMNRYLSKIEYNGMVVNQENIDSFWLIGNSSISPRQQIEFLQKLANKELSISSNTFNTLMDIMIDEDNSTYTIRAKTGLSVGDGLDIGWYVGWMETKANKVYFATRLSPVSDKLGRDEFIPLRKSITLDALKILNYL